jgi:hypothetical protein
MTGLSSKSVGGKEYFVGLLGARNIQKLLSLTYWTILIYKQCPPRLKKQYKSESKIYRDIIKTLKS